MKNIIRNWPNARWASYFLLGVLFWIVAAASFSGFVGKWGLLDGANRNGIEKMLDGTANKPFVYRQLVPWVANAASGIVPDAVKGAVVEKIKPSETFTRAASANSPEIRFRYIVVYYSSFVAIFLSLFVLRAVVLQVGCGEFEATLAPIAVMLAFPYLQTVGGYFYDSVEILFLSLVFLMALRGNVLALVVLVIPATLNKETFFFFVPALYPILKSYYGARRAAYLVLIFILTSGAVNVLIKQMFSGAAGGAAEFHLFGNLTHYIQPRTYRQLEITYGIIGPHGMSIVTLVAIAIIAYRGWSYCSNEIKQHILVALAINVPLFMTFAAAGELRNLSLVFVGFTILSAYAIARINSNGVIPNNK